MFKKKSCKNCGKKLREDYDFCPSCGGPAGKKDSGNWGLLGKNDSPEFKNEIKLPIGVNTLFKTLLKNFEKQLNDMDKQLIKESNNENLPKIRKGGLSINISTSGNGPPEIKIQSFGNTPFRKKEQQIKKQINKSPSVNLSPDSLKKFSKLPREEPSTKIRRLGDKVIYEVNLPGVKSLEDTSIVQLEKSIEIKAIAKDKAYAKLIPISMPITNYKIDDEKLILELEAKD